MAAQAIGLNPTIRGPEAHAFENLLARKIAGQSGAVRAVADLFQLHRAELCSAGRPVGNLLFLGPTGSGKTRVVEAAAEILFGDCRALIKVDCAEFQHAHEISKLVGSPPGYLGHRETHPLITQEALARFHTERPTLSFLLFDEIEKSSDALWQLLLGVMDKATLTLGDNRRVDLSRTMLQPLRFGQSKDHLYMRRSAAKRNLRFAADLSCKHCPVARARDRTRLGSSYLPY